jgi:preprotein translocase subunit SecF
MAVAFAITQREIDLVVVAAFLTVAGFSINDTIVIFDRIRENMHLNPRATLGQLINQSINETLSRTVITSVTVVGALLVLYFMGGEALNSFSFAMLVGCICGFYTTIALTTPLVYVWSRGDRGDHQQAAVASHKEEKKAVQPAQNNAPAHHNKSMRKNRRNRR